MYMLRFACRKRNRPWNIDISSSPRSLSLSLSLTALYAPLSFSVCIYFSHSRQILVGFFFKRQSNFRLSSSEHIKNSLKAWQFSNSLLLSQFFSKTFGRFYFWLKILQSLDMMCVCVQFLFDVIFIVYEKLSCFQIRFLYKDLELNNEHDTIWYFEMRKHINC